MTKSFLRPSLSDIRPKTSAPTTSPARYTLASAPAWVELRPSESLFVRSATTPLATVISRPSRIQATPRATTMRVWNGDHGNRSIRAGMRLRMTPGVRAWLVVVIDRLRAGLTGWDCRSVFPRKPHVNPPVPEPLPDRGTPHRPTTFARRAAGPAAGGHHTAPRIESARRGHARGMRLPY